MIRMKLIDLDKPRKLYDVPERVKPTPFGRQRALEIREQANTKAKMKAEELGMCSWSECLDDVMTQGEKAYVIALWETIESGGSTYSSTFMAFLNGHLEQ